MAPSRSKLIYQLKVTLQEISPPIWRRILVPAKSTFWDLNVAIQDAMGWLDCHLHSFDLRARGTGARITIGIPEDDPDLLVIPGWEMALSEHFVAPGTTATYTYDFGDDWTHDVLLEGILLPEPSATYPRCIAGERACPPEDCGSVRGYYELLRVLASPNTRERKAMVSWLEGHPGNYWPYDSERFEAESVEFSDPRKRWRAAFPARRA